jgi:hypothetical protein
MAELAISKDFLAAYARLQKPVQRAVDAAIAKFSEHTHAGMHLEKLKHACDSRIRTIRITDFWRGVVLALGQNRYVLYHVLPHDDAYTFAANRVFTVNPVLGVLEVHDHVALESFATTVSSSQAGMFDHVTDADLVRLGIDPRLLPCIRAFVSDEQVEALQSVLPQAHFDVLTGLASGMSVEEVHIETEAARLSHVDTDDLFAAAQRTPERIRFVSGPIELAAILDHPFDVWRVFLHPTQRDCAYRETYSGPAYITGSAGTGKTVTGLHRAVFLAERLPADGPGVLLTTFTRALAMALQTQLRLLTASREVLGRIDVISIGRLAYKTVASGLAKLNVADETTVRGLFDSAAATTAGPARFTSSFLHREWEQVILAQQLSTLEDYLAADRHGLGVLRQPAREQVWHAIAHVTGLMRKAHQWTHLQLAGEATRMVIADATPPYRHAIVDEGQDLHPAQWRLLRALVPSGANDLFILADPHQRIYDSKVSLARLGIEVRGRSRKLNINYRTTHEILEWSMKVLNGAPAVGLDDAPDSLARYRSVTRGAPPELSVHQTPALEAEAVIERVGTWLEQGVEANAIAVAARTNQRAETLAAALRQAYIPVAADSGTEPGVYVATMHRLKGLEFQCLVVAGLEAGEIPSAQAVTPLASDPIAHQLDVQRERCLLFVAMTRARDVLFLSHAGQASSLLPEQAR